MRRRRAVKQLKSNVSGDREDGDGVECLPAKHEEEEEADDYDCEDDPADPVIPCASVAAPIAILVVASSHGILVLCLAVLSR